jgi:hypothetical protein
MPDHQLAASIVESGGFSLGFVSDFSWTIARMFLETFLASKTKLTKAERKTLTDGLSILKKYLEKKV